MVAGRTVTKHVRAYVDGIDMSGFTRNIGPLAHSFDQAEGTTLSDAVKGILMGHAFTSPGTLTGNLDDTANGLHATLNDAGQKRDVMVPIGIKAAPTEGDPVFCAEAEQQGYESVPIIGGQLVAVTIPFGGYPTDAVSRLYSRPWGFLAHEKSAETAASTAGAQIDHEAQTTEGGYMTFHAFTADGTVTIKIQDASTNTNPNFSDLLTSGVIDPSAAPVSNFVHLGISATVERYIRWQIVLGTATTVTFALAFVRGNGT